MTPLIESYIERARAAGMLADQLRNFLRAGIVLQDKQIRASVAARQCDEPCRHGEESPCGPTCPPTKIGFGGARSGGKSHWGLSQIVADDMTRHPGIKFLYLRKVGKTGKEAVQDLRREVLHSVEHEWKESDRTLSLPSGSKCILGHFQAEKDIDDYLGLQYDGVLVEEATQLTHRKVKDIETCVRTSKVGWRPRMYFTTNPGNVGHAWFKKLFIEPMRRGEEGDTRFIQSTVRDNRFVNIENRRSLESLTGWQRRAWLDGDWDIAAGQYMSTFREALHVARFEAAPHWEYWLALDYGFVHNTYVSLQARDDDGMLRIIDEHCANRTVPEAHAEAIQAMLAKYDLDAWDLSSRVAGHDVFSPDQSGGTIAEEYAAHGIVLTRANIARIQGATEILRRLGDPSGTPPREASIVIHERCARLIECLPALIHNPNNPEDVLKVDADEEGKGGDDPYDGFRYGVMQAARVDPGRAATAKKRR